MANKIELWKEKYYKHIIFIYFILLISIAFGLNGLFTDSRDMGYMSTSTIYPDLKEVWFSILTFCFGLFYGIAIIVGKFDWTRRIQSVLILVASIIVAVAYTYIVILRPIIFFSGLAIGAYVSHITRTKEEKYVEYKVSLMILAIAASTIVWLTLLNYIAGKSRADTSLLYFLLASAFSVVFYKFATYPINKCKLFIIGPQRSGKSVFTCALYDEAKKQKRVIGKLEDYLAELYERLHSGLWLLPNIKTEHYDLSYVHGHLFKKEINLDIDYAGEDFENQIDAIIEYLRRKGIDPNIQPSNKIEDIADGIYDANKLIFLIDPDRTGLSKEKNYINNYYRRILNEIPGKSYCLVVTKSDKLYDGKKPDKNYDKFKEYVVHEIEKKEPFFDTIEPKAEDVLPVMFFEKDKKPVIKGDGYYTFGYDKVLEVVGR